MVAHHELTLHTFYGFTVSFLGFRNFDVADNSMCLVLDCLLRRVGRVGCFSLFVAMAVYKVRLFALEDEVNTIEMIGRVACQPHELYSSFRVRLEEAKCVEWGFDFWDFEEQCRIKTRMEGVDTVGDSVYVIQARHGDEHDRAKRMRLHVGGDVPEEVAATEEVNHSPDFHPIDSGEADPSSRVTTILDYVDQFSGHDFKSVLLSKEVQDKYVRAASKLRKELADLNLQDNLWHLRSWDDGEVSVVKLHCGECKKEFGGQSGDHSKAAIHNLINNFKVSHIVSTIHAKAWCRRKGVSYDDHPQDKSGRAIVLTASDHKAAVQEGLGILQSVNDGVSAIAVTFVVVGDTESEIMKSFWYKVRCTVCGDMFVLCPSKKNLRTNLENHIHGIKHTKALEEAAAKSTSSALSTGRRGRPPPASRGLQGTQQSLHDWFRITDRTNESQASSGKQNEVFSLLCWGYWGRTAMYSNLVYNVHGLLADPKHGNNWAPEPSTRTELRDRNGIVVIVGCFRHVRCARVSLSGEPFENYTCAECRRIPKEDDFRKRVFREDRSIDKRGTRTPVPGRRIDCLSVHELALHNRILGRKFREERAMRWSMKARVVQLKMAKHGLRLSAQENFNRKDVLSVCNNILAAHRTNAFGGKPALWDFLRDVANNLNRQKQGHRFSNNSKSFCQAMKVYGGRRMCDLFSLNFAAPSYSTVKRENIKGVRFVAGEHPLIFQSVARIYREAKNAHGVTGPVPIILAEDETKVKARITWEPQFDVLAGFCGSKINHKCVVDFKPYVGEGNTGYENILDAFRGDKIGSFARVIMVNPLHAKLPRLVLAVSCTCNCFDSCWVRSHWGRIDSLWKLHCEESVGPVVGHASDGDSRRRQLMLEDYTGKSGHRFEVPWEGFVLSAVLGVGNRVQGLHDQDFIHNGKKLINPLDSVVKTLQLGLDICCLGHVGQVYNKYTFDQHGLRQEDVNRSDRQNWASAQRLCALKVRTCLKDIRVGRDTHQERTLGTEMYLQICADYVDIFLSVSLDLRQRIVLASKVSFFFRIWRLWFQHGDHAVGGNTKNLTTQECFVSNQCFLDVQISCHFVVLLIKYFREHHDNLPVPLHLTGSDACEIFFSKVGGMQGMERAYDFHELVNCANTLNQLSAIEYGDNGLKFDRVHNKQRNIWAELHPLEEGMSGPDLGDYSLINDDSKLIDALKEGLREAQSMIRILNMGPSSVAREKKWFMQPWLVESNDPKYWAYVPPKKATTGDDGDGEALRDAMVDTDANDNVVHLEDELEDDPEPLGIAEGECMDALSELMDAVEPPAPSLTNSGATHAQTIVPTVEYGGKTIYKSTLVSELNGNPYLSKDRLTRVRNSVYFNNSEDYLSAASCESTMLLGIGSDCGVFFVQRNTTTTSSAVKAAQRRGVRSSGRRGRPTPVSLGVDVGTWWLGRVQKIKRQCGKQWGNCRNPIDMMNRTCVKGKKVSSTPSIMVLLNWFTKSPGHLKYKYEGSDTQWIDIDSVISTVSMSFNMRTNVYTLDDTDAKSLDEFVRTDK